MCGKGYQIQLLFNLFLQKSSFEKLDQNNDGVLKRGEWRFHAGCDTNRDKELVLSEAMKCPVWWHVEYAAILAECAQDDQGDLSVSFEGEDCVVRLSNISQL